MMRGWFDKCFFFRWSLLVFYNSLSLENSKFYFSVEYNNRVEFGVIYFLIQKLRKRKN